MESSTDENKITPPPQTVGYSRKVGFVYVFNLLVGAAILTLPQAFGETGWLLGLAVLAVLAVMSYITVSFTIEAMGMANAMLAYKARRKKWRKMAERVDDATDEIKRKDVELKDNIIENTNVNETDRVEFKCAENKIVINNNEMEREDRPNIEITEDDYDIKLTVDYGEMSRLFFPKIGTFLFYVSICLYLYGGMSVYVASIAKSLTTVVCNDPKCFTGNASMLPCHTIKGISVNNVYKIVLAFFTVIICPFAYFNISQTKILQLFTTTYRWFSMISMIALAFRRIAKGQGNSTPNVVVIDKLPEFFGVAVYSFMCQHSIPAVLTPVTKKKGLHLLTMLSFVCVVMFYVTLLMSAVFAFQEFQDLYTLNFEDPIYMRYPLQLYPVMTLSANFPVLAIVLRQNLKKLFLRNSEKDYGVFLGRILFPTIVVLPPVVIAFFTYDVGVLVQYTGAYAGAIIQYIVPAMLVYCGRKKVTKLFNGYRNPYRSPFRSQFWVVLLIAWYLVSLGFVLYSKLK